MTIETQYNIGDSIEFESEVLEEYIRFKVDSIGICITGEETTIIYYNKTMTIQVNEEDANAV